MAGLCRGSKQSPGGAGSVFLHPCIAKIHARSPSGLLEVDTSFSVGRSHGKVLRAKSRAKLLPAAGGSGCPQLLPQALPKCAPNATGREGGHGLGPSCRGDNQGSALLPRCWGHRATTGQELNETPTYSVLQINDAVFHLPELPLHRRNASCFWKWEYPTWGGMQKPGRQRAALAGARHPGADVHGTPKPARILQGGLD